MGIILEMEEETIFLSWKSFQPQLSSTLDELYQSKNFADVTLVSDDQIHTKAHKSILSASSPVLKNLLITNPNSHPILYLRGIEWQELVSLLQFVYLGEVSLCQDRLKKFFDSAKDLKITEIGEDCSDCGNILATIDPNVLKTEVQSTVGQLIEWKVSVSEDEDQPPRTVFGPVPDNYNPVRGYPCNQCDHQEPSQWGLITHQESTHGEGVYSCDQCEYRATTQMGLKN